MTHYIDYIMKTTQYYQVAKIERRELSSRESHVLKQATVKRCMKWQD